jgi:hypothetical protein
MKNIQIRKIANGWLLEWPDQGLVAYDQPPFTRYIAKPEEIPEALEVMESEVGEWIKRQREEQIEQKAAMANQLSGAY